MKKALRDAGSIRVTGMFAALVVWLVAGCASIDLPTPVQDLGSGYKPSNVYRNGKTLPPDVRRVALLPVTMTSSTTFLESGVENLEPLVYSELEKTKRFEIIPVTRDQLRQWSGQTGWRIDEELPKDLFAKIHSSTGCDAVIFSQLTRYQPYQPIAIGWKFNLIVVTGAKPLTLWSADEVLDSGDPVVATAARQYYTQHLRNEAPSADSSTMAASPTRFGQYTIATLMTTIPDRPGPGK